MTRFRDDDTGSDNGETVVLELRLVHETDSAFKVSEHEFAPEVWLPKSLVHVTHRKGKTVTMICPEWLATERGLT